MVCLLQAVSDSMHTTLQLMKYVSIGYIIYIVVLWIIWKYTPLANSHGMVYKQCIYEDVSRYQDRDYIADLYESMSSDA